MGVALTAAAVAAAAGLTLLAQARMPQAGAEPSTSTSATPSPTASASGSAADYPSDKYGFVDSAARCDDEQMLMAFGRTSRALVAICVDSDGDLEYRGVRLSDETPVTLAAGRSSDGSIVATNNGVTYAVSPEMLLVSDGDTVLYRDSWLEFRQPRFSGEPAATSSSETTTSETTRTGPTTTVSTTTVTVTPTPSASGE